MSDWPYCTHGHANRPKGCVACCHDRIVELEGALRKIANAVTAQELFTIQKKIREVLGDECLSQMPEL